MATGVVQKRRVISLEEKLSIIREVDENPKTKRVEIAKKLQLPASTVNTILQNRKKILQEANKCGVRSQAKRSKIRVGKHKELEEVLVRWIQQVRASNMSIDGGIVREKARMLATKMNLVNFVASNGWLDRFKNRHGVVYEANINEYNDADEETELKWKQNLSSIISLYDPKNVFTADETGLFFNVLPNETLSVCQEPCHKGQKSKDRVTILLVTNEDGSEKLPPLVIGKFHKPQCFKNIQSLPCKYASNSKAWMTLEIFEDFLRAFDACMGYQSRKVLLFVNQCAVHPNDTSYLQNVLVIFYPANYTSILQPLELGIIMCIKQQYRKQLAQRTLALMELENVNLKLNVLQAMHFIVAAWNQVTSIVISNCFRAAGFIRDYGIEGSIEVMVDMVNIERWNNFKAGVSFQEYVLCDKELAVSEVTLDNMLKQPEENLNQMEVESDNEDVSSPLPGPKFSDVVQSIETIKRFIYSLDSISDNAVRNISNMEQMLYDLNEEAEKQSKFEDCTKMYVPEISIMPS